VKPRYDYDHDFYYYYFNTSARTYTANSQEKPGCYGHCLRIRTVNNQVDWSQYHSDIDPKYYTPVYTCKQ